MNMTSIAAYQELTVLPVLQEIEEKIRQVAAAPDNPCCSELTRRLIQAGGKRLRPLLVVLSSGINCAAGREPVIDVAVAAELIHTASLIHDDILDSAGVRRGVPTINSLRGNHAAVLAGDYLFATAFGLLAGKRTSPALPLMSEAIRAMCEGEIAETYSLFRTDLTEDEYLSHIEQKTASLLGACCGAGALVGGAAPETAAALVSYGRYLGLAFQIVDDLLDFISDEETLGKPAGSDLTQGIVTLPVIYLLRESVQSAALEEIITRGNYSPADFARIKQAALETAALTSTYQKALEYTGRAGSCLAAVPDLPSRELLLDIADQVISQVYLHTPGKSERPSQDQDFAPI